MGTAYKRTIYVSFNYVLIYYAYKKIFSFSTGFPNCGSHQIWPIYSNNSTDLLDILSNGGLRHSLYHSKPFEDYDDMSYIQNELNEVMHYDYEPGRYCMEKVTIKCHKMLI